jgi:hypothetical protein
MTTRQELSTAIVGWASEHWPGRYWIRVLGEDVEITEAFARRINNADMGETLRGRQISGQMLEVTIGPRYR